MRGSGSVTIIEDMFDDEFTKAREYPAALGDLVAETHAAERLHGCRRLVLAAAWADLFTDPDELPERDPDGAWRERVGPRGTGRVPRRGGPDTEGFIRPGGRGTPWIAETCPAELGLWQQQSPGSARCLIGDALDLRHRLPRLWSRIVAGEVHAWKARTVAARSRYLGPGPVAELDRLIAGELELLTWGRFEKVLDATLLHVDPVAYNDRIEESHSRRGVWPGEGSAGLRTIIIRAAQGDTAVFWAAVNLIADLLADEGDEDPLTVRRSKAVGILGNPAAALDLLNRHTEQPDPADDPLLSLPDPTDINPWHPEPRPGWDTTPYHQSDPADPDYQAGQHPPDPGSDPQETDTEEFDDEPADPHTRRHTGGQTAEQHDPPDPCHAQSSTGPGNEPAALTRSELGQPRRPLLPDGRLSLRPVTRAERNASRPRVHIVFHLTDEAVRRRHGVVRTDTGPITADQLRHFLTDTDANITIHPVLDPAGVAAVDSYEIPPQLRMAITTRNPDSVFPYGGSSTGRTELDHTIPYRRGGPPGQTNTGNLGPLTRTEHRAKTVGHWNVRQPSPGTYLWRSPHGWIALTTNQGTLMLGNNRYARGLWDSAGRDLEGAA